MRWENTWYQRERDRGREREARYRVEIEEFFISRNSSLAMASLLLHAPAASKPRLSAVASRIPPSTRSSAVLLFSRPKSKDGVLGLMRRKGSLVAANPLEAMNDPMVLDGRIKRKEERPIIVIDNYDSFTYNLCQYLGELGANFVVYRNDEINVEEVKDICPRGILISPGPGAPQDSGISLQTVLELGPSIPLFGVCMGLQCIGEAFGGKIVRSPFGVVHGKKSPVYYDEKLEPSLFSGMPNPFSAGRYHSLVIEKESFPSDVLEITAWSEDGLVMGIRHKKYSHIQGVQFHPESIITTEGRIMVRNFIKIIESHEREIPAFNADQAREFLNTNELKGTSELTC